MINRSKLYNFLRGLSDHELSILIGYSCYGSISGSKEKLMTEVKRRKLSRERLKKYFNLRLHNKEDSVSCIRCGSTRLVVETDYEYKYTKHNGNSKIAVDTLLCRLCGCNQEKETPKNIFSRIRKSLFNQSNKKVVQWDTW